MEYWIVGRMLKEGLDVYLPLVDDHAVDAIIRRKNGSTALVQIKARSTEVKYRDAALFAAIPHVRRKDYWFVFYSERMDKTWILSSKEFLKESNLNKSGKGAGLRSIWFNGARKNKHNGKHEEYVLPRFERYIASDFSRILA